jgi:hypothetical protein
MSSTGAITRKRLSSWLLLGVVLGILPVIANYLTPVFAGSPFSLAGPLADGELLIASTAIAGGAIGELFSTQIRDEKLQQSANIFGGLTVIFCVLCALAYALVRSSNSNSARSVARAVVAPNAAAVGAMAAQVSESGQSPAIGPVIGSLVLFVITMIVAGRCVRVSAAASGV